MRSSEDSAFRNPDTHSLDEQWERLLRHRHEEQDLDEGRKTSAPEGERIAARCLWRYERRAENYLGFMRLGCIVILLKYL